MVEAIGIEKIKKLREETGVGVMEVKRALEEAGGDLARARRLLKERGLARAQKKRERQTGEGRVFAYIHATGKIGALLELFCETDFVARTEDFNRLGHELAMQVAAMAPADSKELLAQEYIRDPSRKVAELVDEVIAKVGENIKVGRFVRYGV